MVIAIIGILVAILLPAINAAREAARRTQCLDNLKNIGLAANNHLIAHKFFPSGGWGWSWTGDPDRGYNERQPGGWLYNIMAFMEEAAIHDMGKGLPEAQKKAAASERIRRPLPWATCPTRRELRLYPNQFVNNLCYNCQGPMPEVARSDYVANCGGVQPTATAQEMNSKMDRQRWHRETTPPTTTIWLKDGKTRHAMGRNPNKQCGISFERSKVSVKHIKDGVSYTYFVGERYLNRTRYGTGQDAADNEHMYTGFDNDMFHTTEKQPLGDGELGDTDDNNRWGSAHAHVFHVVFCDGSTHRIPYEVDVRIHQLLGHRSDGRVVELDF